MGKGRKENLVVMSNYGLVVVYWLSNHGPIGCGWKASKLLGLDLVRHAVKDKKA